MTDDLLLALFRQASEHAIGVDGFDAASIIASAAIQKSISIHESHISENFAESARFIGNDLNEAIAYIRLYRDALVAALSNTGD